jgi:trimeric autotransporter adhesin
MNPTAIKRNLLCFFSLLIITNAIQAAPGNDAISAATPLTSGITPTPTNGNFWNTSAATATGGINVFCIASGLTDVWYYFVARTTFPTVSLTNIGTGATSLSTNNGIQIFNTGSTNPSIISTITVATLNANSVACSYSSGTTKSLTPGSALTLGNVYLIRVASGNTANSTTSRWAFSIAVNDPVIAAGRSNEVFLRTTLSGSGALQYPWEITYGPDNMLWITESRGYKVYKMDPLTGAKTTVLDLNSASTDLSAWGADSLRAVNLTSTANWNATANNWPQGGLAGLAIHPQFGDGTGHDYVYISYVHRYLSTAAGSAGIFFRNKIVRFTYNSGTGKLGTPAVVCDTIPGGQDHNSQRMIIAPVGGSYYLFYANGDMGAGQFSNRMRPQNAQTIDSYEGKILRFNIDTVGMPGPDKWIPGDNPYNTILSKQSAVYSIGIRNNQGFAFDTVTNRLYGAMHGPYSDDEINIIEGFKNYGHPLIEGFVDGNYNGNSSQGTNTSVSAGAPWTDNSGVSTCLPIGNEATNKASLDAVASIKGAYKDPLFSAYPVPAATVLNIWQTNPGNATPAPGWPTEAWSGLDLYSNKLIPGWKRSLVVASLKWGRLVRLKLSTDGLATAPTNTIADTITYLNSQNRFRDLAFSPDGKDIFVIMDNTSTTSGPGNAFPTVPTCAGCVEKYTFLGYMPDATGRSTISSIVDVAAGTANACQTGTTITIDNSNNYLWVPITGQDGNVVAEIKANGNNLGTVTTSFYTNTGAVRENSSKKLYSNRNITITPQVQPSSTVNIRIYMTVAEYNSLRLATNSQGAPSGISSIGNISILKNSDACGASMVNSTTVISPQYAEAFGSNYVLQGDISSFSTFYLGNPSQTTLPAQLLTFTARLENDNSSLLQWKTTNEVKTSQFFIERSVDGTNFIGIGKVSAAGAANVETAYSYIDADAGVQSTSILYYRLRIIDINGQYSYSKVVSIILTRNINVFLYPNPTKHSLNIQINGTVSNPVWIQVSDLNGRIIYSEKRNVVQSTTVTLDVKQWKAQMYVLKIVNSKNEIITSQKFQKL